MKKLHIKTWGCQMNIYDSARIADVVRPLGYEETDDVTQADMVIFNTCHIREKATEKLFSELGRLRDIQKERAEKGLDMLIGVAGCVAQAEGEEIQRRAPYVSLVFGPQIYHKLPEMIAALSAGQKRVLNTDFPVEPKFDFLPTATEKPSITTFLTIQEGCDRFCSYCVVPYTRGSEYSRPPASVLAEARALVDKGVREITLLGQNVNAYQVDNTSFAQLIYQLAEIPNLLRIRYMTSHPCDMKDDLIQAHRDVPLLMPFLHLPVQSGSDAVLIGMNRKHTSDDYRRLVDKLRTARPDLALSSDFIVGFPGETEADFQATMKLVQDVNFALAFSFKYSRRLGTPAAVMTNQIDEETKARRLTELQLLLREQQRAYNASFQDKVVPVLFDAASRRNEHVFGRTPYLHSVHVKGPHDLVGQVHNVRITTTSPNSLRGILEETTL